MFKVGDIVVVTGSDGKGSDNYVIHYLEPGDVCRVIDKEELESVRVVCLEGNRKGWVQFINVWNIKHKDYESNAEAISLLRTHSKY